MKVIFVDAVHGIVSENGVFFEEMYRLLEKYPNKKIVLTNATDDKFVYYGLDKLPYEVFSLNHNPEKTDPEYYRILLKHFNLKKEDVICFENKAEAVKSAQSVGITTFHYDRDKRDLLTLKKFIDENI